jgi:hypothetical protein
VILVLLAVVAAVAAVGGYAYWTSTGTGTGSAAVGTSTVWQVTTLAYAGGPLTPGGGSGTYETVAYNVTNNSTGQQSLANVNVKVAQSDGSAWSAQANGAKPACTAADFQLSVDGGTTWAAAGASANDTALAGNRAPGSTTSNATITIRMVDNGANQDNCKSQTVPLYLSAS